MRRFEKLHFGLSIVISAKAGIQCFSICSGFRVKPGVT